MKTIDDVLNYLDSYNNLLPYTIALGFSYTHNHLFRQQFKPTYKTHFKPFEKYRDKTFFCIDDFSKYFKRTLTNEMMKTLEYEGVLLGVSYIFVVGVEDEEANKLAWAEGLEISDVSTGTYTSQIRCKADVGSDPENDDRPIVNEFDMLRVILKEKFLDKYELSIDNKTDNIVSFSNNLI